MINIEGKDTNYFPFRVTNTSVFRNFGRIRRISLYKGVAEDWENSGLRFGDRSGLNVLL